jgi:anti-sigma factor RsiW
MFGFGQISCEEMVELVTDYLEGAMPRATRRRFERHLRGCDGCTTYVEQMRETVVALGRLPEEEIPAGALDELLVAFRDWRRA